MGLSDHAGRAFTAPVIVTEFGTCNTDPSCVASSSGQGQWFQAFAKYLTDGDLDWMYWPLNGTDLASALTNLAPARVGP